MTLSDMMTYHQIVGSLMRKPTLFLEYTDIQPSDFDFKPARACFLAIKNLYEDGALELSPLEVDQEISRLGGLLAAVYTENNGLTFIKDAYEHSQVGNFEAYYIRLKKYSLLRQLRKAHYDISKFYLDPKDVTDPRQEIETIKRCDEASIEDILNSVEKDYTEIRNNFLHGGKLNGDPAEGINQLIDELIKNPNVGPDLEGHIFSSVCRGAREGCFFLKSASTSGGKSRTSVFDACRIAYPKRWSNDSGGFIEEVTNDGAVRIPRKVLFIVTEMDKEELQTIMLAYLSGVNEDHIIRGKYEPGEESRVRAAAKIIQEYSGYFLIEEINEPNLQNVESTIRKYATVDKVKYVFFDYIHTTSSLFAQFSKNNVREDVILMMLANQLKQLAKNYNIFIFSATQVNALAMGDDEMKFKDEKSIRGSKAVADKCDVGCVMTRISEVGWNTVLPTFKAAIRAGTINQDILNTKPTHVIDIYKMRRGRYKMIRIWTFIHLGTGARKDLFVTTADNQPLPEPINLFSTMEEHPIEI